MAKTKRSGSPTEGRRWGVEHAALVVLGLCPLVVFLSQTLPPENKAHLGEALERFRSAETTTLDAGERIAHNIKEHAKAEIGALRGRAAADVKYTATASASKRDDEHKEGADMPSMYDDGSGESIIVGEDQCAAFRAGSTDRRRTAVAGLFNTGTNLMWKLMRNNCVMPRECSPRPKQRFARYDNEALIMSELVRYRSSQTCVPFFHQAPWGKHNPLHWRGMHTAMMMEYTNTSEILPVMVVKDPLTWFRSMCKMSYAVLFRHDHCQCCPSPLSKTSATVAWRKEFKAYHYDSIVHMWSEWNAEYFDTKLPRLIVRYEDLLWRPEETTRRVCNCVGGKMRDDFVEIENSAKHGPGHGFSTGTASDFAAKYGNESKRYDGFMDDDLAYVKEHADDRLVQKFHYQSSTRRRRELQPNSTVCKPTREAYLATMQLKVGPNGAPIPMDDESEGVIAAGRFYANPKKPNSATSLMLKRQHQIERDWESQTRAVKS